MSTEVEAGTSKQKERSLISSLKNQYPFIEEVPNDRKKVTCTICNRELVVSTMNKFKTHVESKPHRNNAEIRTADRIDKYFNRFSLKWMEDPRFKHWLQVVQGDRTKFRCDLCEVERSCIGGVSNLVRHAELPGHVKKCKELGVITLDDLPAEVIQESKDSFDARLFRREAEYARLGCINYVPFETMPKFLKFSQETPPLILEEMTAGPTKISAMNRNLLAPLEEEHLISLLKINKFSVFVDETTDPNNRRKWFRFLVKFVDPETFHVRMELLRILQLDSTQLNAKGLFTILKNYMDEKGIPFSNVIAVSCDNASVMIGKLNSFFTLIREKNPSILLFPCICHRIALIAKASFDMIPLEVEKFLHSICNHIGKSTKRLEAFEQIMSNFQEKAKAIINYMPTRWLSRHQCIERILELYPILVDHFGLLCVSGKNATFEEINNQLLDLRIKAYLHFLNYILGFFNRFNLFFQSEETRVHLLHSESLKFLTMIVRHFLKPAWIPLLVTGTIDFFSPNNLKELHEIDFGFECNNIISELSINIEENACVIQEIREKCLGFYQVAAKEIFSKLECINDEFFVNLSVFEAERAFFDADRDVSFLNVWNVASKLGVFDREALREEWNFLQVIVSSHLDLATLNFDSMWEKVLSTTNQNEALVFPHLRSLMTLICSFPNPNAPAERAFSMLPNIVTKKRSSDSVNAAATITALSNQDRTAQISLIPDDQSLENTSKRLYEPAKKKEKLLYLHAGDETMDN